MSFKDKIRKAWGKILIGVGTAVLAVGIGAFKYIEHAYDVNVLTWKDPFDNAVFLGDTGEDSDIRARTVRMVDDLPVRFVVLLGDQEYETGVRAEAGFIKHIMKPFYRSGRDVLEVEGNHGHLALTSRDYLLTLGRSGKYPWFHYDTYWKLHIFPNACLLLADSATADIKLFKDGEFEALNTFVAKATQDKRCDGKDKIFGAHHPIWSPGKSHGDRRPDGYTRMYERYVRGWARIAVFGHEHVTALEVVDVWNVGPINANYSMLPTRTLTFKEARAIQMGTTTHYIVGGTSKFNTCVRGRGLTCWDDRPGFAYYGMGRMELMK